MEKFRRILLKILFPHIAFVLLFVPIAAALLIYVFLYSETDSAVSYIAYFLSAYALTLVCARMPDVWKKAKVIKQKNKYINRYTSDAELRVQISLYSSFTMNILYALMQLWLGIINHSIWFYALAGYYALLVVTRFFLLKEIRRNRLGQNKYFEYLIYRLCGVLLVLMNMALAVVVFYIVWQNRGFEHHYIVTIAMAAYTFFTLTMAIINMIRYRKHESPVISATKVISLAAALVSVLSLETAMLTAFGNGNDAAFRQIMTACTGSAVCVAVLTIAILMIVRSTKEIKRLKSNQDKEALK